MSPMMRTPSTRASLASSNFAGTTSSTARHQHPCHWNIAVECCRCSQQSRWIRQYRPRYSTAHLQLVCGLKIEDDSEAGTSGPGANKAGAITDTPKGCKGGARRRSVAPTKRGATVGMSKKSEKPKVQCISFGNG